MKFKELQQKDTQELQTLLDKNREEIRVFKFNFTGNTKDSMIIRKAKKTIARILTLENMRDLINSDITTTQ